MTAMRPYGRGYRLAMRDVQASVELLGHGQYESYSVNAAIFMAASAVTYELQFFRQIKNAEDQTQSLNDTNTFKVHNKDAFFNGYLAGFKRGQAIILQHANKMSFEPARKAVKETYAKLQKHEVDLIGSKYHAVYMLRRRKFVLS